MKIKMLTGLSGPDVCLSPGDIAEFEEAEAVRLIEAGYAVPHAPKKTEKAEKPDPAQETR